MMSLEPVFHLCRREPPIHPSKPIPPLRIIRPFFLTSTSSNNYLKFNASFTTFYHTPQSPSLTPSVTDTPIFQRSHTNTFQFNRTQMVEGKIIVRLDHGKDLRDWELIVGCNLPGKWILHWGVTYLDDVGREWDRPPHDMIPPGSVPIKDYAVETPLKKASLSAEGDLFHEVRIDLKSNKEISAINFVLKDEETEVWYKHKGRDFKVSLVNYLKEDINNFGEDINNFGAKRGFNLWPGNLGEIFKMFLKSKAGQDDCIESRDPKEKNNQVEDFYEEVPITKKVLVNNSIGVSIKKCFESEAVKHILYFETDLPGDVVLHWGVCRDDSRRWEVPRPPHPPGTVAFKDKALRTQLQPRDGGKGSSALITIGEEFSGFIFVLKQNENTWFKNKGNDFYVPLSSSSSLLNIDHRKDQSEGVEREVIEEASQEASFFAFTDGIINEIRNMVKDNSSEKSQKMKSKKAQQSIFQEIERLAAEAFNIFRSSIPTFSETTTTVEPEATIVKPKATTIVVPEASVESETLTLGPKICSATGTGYEILCQGFNWESHKSGRWYMELKDKASELASLGFTVVWLPPPTESVSPEGYMPMDLYNLNSRYGNIDELKDLVKRFHEVGIKALGDAVLNHRCAHYQNQNGIWNIFGGRLNWDDRAIVADDPHFQGRGNRSSGDNFHAAPNIDHSQEFVRRDLKEWLCWLRKEIGYDGWRLDFARGFWGGYVKDYVDASEPCFAVGEYWDSLSYTYCEMDNNQDAHRQRIVDWISDTNGTAAAFDVTTKGILHSALERCEYWRLSDQQGNPPGVVGWWPSRAVTFLENHDTGSTQGHWRFPCGKEMQGYAYILTHPGTPSVFFDHIFSPYKTEIATLISLRKRNKIHCKSTVQIIKADRDVYAAMIDEKIAMKIGPGHFEPPSGSHKWSLAIDGSDYKIWEAS